MTVLGVVAGGLVEQCQSGPKVQRCQPVKHAQRHLGQVLGHLTSSQLLRSQSSASRSVMTENEPRIVAVLISSHRKRRRLKMKKMKQNPPKKVQVDRKTSTVIVSSGGRWLGRTHTHNNKQALRVVDKQELDERTSAVSKQQAREIRR